MEAVYDSGTTGGVAEQEVVTGTQQLIKGKFTKKISRSRRPTWASRRASGAAAARRAAIWARRRRDECRPKFGIEGWKAALTQ